MRDLGGLCTADGHDTRWGGVVRADNVERLTAAGWRALQAHGVRTIVDLRNAEEQGTDDAPRPDGISTLHVPLDDRVDVDMWRHFSENGLQGTPLYYRPFLERKPERCAAAVRAVARAEPGGVVVHCVGGRDRTGLISLLLLALVGVLPADIAADYEHSNRRLPPLWARLGLGDQRGRVAAQLERKNTSERDSVLEVLEWLDSERYLRSAGVADEDLDGLRERLIES